MKRTVIIITILIAILIASFAGVTFAYTKTSDYSAEAFSDKTTINGVDCSGLTYSQAETKLSKVWNKKHIKIADNLNNELAVFTDFGYKYDLAEQLKNAKKYNMASAALNHYLKTPLNMKIDMTVSDYDSAFKDKIINAGCFKIKGAVPSRDAYVDMNDPEFKIVKEVSGDAPDTEKIFKAVTAHIERGKFTFVFDEKKYYSAPKVTAEDPSLLEYRKFCQKYLKQKITYELGEETFTISREQLLALMKDDMSGKADEAAVRAYVDTLADTYDNIGVERNFTSYTGKDVSVSGGTYGWAIDREGETKHLAADINSHKDISREPVFSSSGYGTYTRTVGDTYIDVDISQQKVRFYKSGELAFSSDCVSGSKASGRLTDIGTFYVINKVRNVVLRGNNNDGSEYASPVQYWMGINWSGEGFHDSNWRTKFGGDIWRYNGSHGCVNLPRQIMPEFYNMTEIGTPVVVHY